MASIIDVAKKAGVSKSTVGRVFSKNDYGVSKDTKEKVIKAANELGYIKNSLASSLRTNQTKTIILLIPDISNYFWAEVSKGAQDYLDSVDYSLLVVSTYFKRETELKYLNIAEMNKIAGILINTKDEMADAIEKTHIPSILLGNSSSKKELPFSRVATDTATGIDKIMKYLFEQGHRDIAIIDPHFANSEREYSNRINSYSQFLSENGVEVNPEFIFHLDATIEEGRKFAKTFADMKNKPTAIICSNDFFAISLVNELFELGINVPSDISIVGVDGIILTDMIRPRLTTLEKQKYEMGRTAAMMLVDQINGKDEITNIKLETKLKIRDSVKKL